MGGKTIGGLIGAVIGAYIPIIGISTGFTLGSMLGGLVMPDELGIQDQEGPRLSDLTVTSSAYGAPIPRVFGSYRISGNVIWSLPIQETKHVTEEEVGKGGTETYEVITYTYSVSMAVALCEGPILGVRRIWADSVLIYNFGIGASVDELEASAQIGSQFKIYKGTKIQNVNWLMQSYNADMPAYRNVAYIVFNDFQLEKFGNRMPNITAEVVVSGSLASNLYNICYNKNVGPYSQTNSKLHGIRWRRWTTGQPYTDFYDFYTNGIDGTTIPGAFNIGSNYYNKGEVSNSIYKVGGVGGNTFTTSIWEGKDQENVNHISDRHNILVSVDSQNIVTNTIINQLAYSRVLYLEGDSDTSDILFYTNLEPGGSYRFYSFGVIGNGLTSSRGLYSHTDPDGNHVWDYIVNDYATYAVPFTFDMAMTSTKFVYDKDTLYFWSWSGTRAGVFTPNRFTYRDFQYISDVEDPKVLVDIAKLDNTPQLLSTSIYNKRIYCLIQNPNLDLTDPYIKVFDSYGIFIENITLKDKLEFFGESISSTTIVYSFFKIEVRDFGIFLYLTLANGSLNFYRLEGSLPTINTSYSYSLLGTFNSKIITPIDFPYAIDMSILIGMKSGYNEYNNTFKMMNSSEEYIIYFDVLSDTNTTLSHIVKSLLIASDLTEIDFNVTAGDSVIVSGFVITKQMTARSALNILQSIYLFDLVEEDFIIKLKLRNNTVTQTIPQTVLGANSTTEIEMNRSLDTEMPKIVTLKYANKDIAYQSGSQATIRIDGNSDNNVLLELPIAFSDTEAKNLAEILMFTTWIEKLGFIFNIPFNSSLKVADVIDIEFESVFYRVRVTSIVIISNYILKCSAVNCDNTYQYKTNAQSTSSGYITTLLGLPDSAELIVFNAPTLDNSIINDFGIYYATSGNSRWKGAEVFKSKDSGSTYTTIGASLRNVPIGISYGILPDGPTHTWDLENTIRVRVHNAAELISITNELVLGGNNYAKIGDEIIQFANVSDIGGDTYILDTLLRGRRGTEWATSLHKNRETFVLLTNNVQFNPSTINTERYYKAVTFGTYLDIADEHRKVYTGTNLIPFAPTNFEVSGYVIIWTRRDRYISGYFNTLPNSEEEEKYKIDFYYLNILLGSELVINATTYTYNPLTYPNIDKLVIAQYSSNLMNYGYTTEIII